MSDAVDVIATCEGCGRSAVIRHLWRPRLYTVRQSDRAQTVPSTCGLVRACACGVFRWRLAVSAGWVARYETGCTRGHRSYIATVDGVQRPLVACVYCDAPPDVHVTLCRATGDAGRDELWTRVVS